MKAMHVYDVVVIGSGFAGLSCAANLAREGYKVAILEKNAQIGGRARIWMKDGFTFDMGPSWYWMPEVFENFYNRFGHSTRDFYDLVRLDPGYRIFWENRTSTDIPADFEKLKNLFESFETGAAEKLEDYLQDAQMKYRIGMGEFVHKPSINFGEYIDTRILSRIPRTNLLRPISRHIDKFFRHEKLKQILAFPVLFLGAKPENTPALYSMMNHADLKLGTWYPMGGMNKVVHAFKKIALEQGVKFYTNCEVLKLEVTNKRVSGVLTNRGRFEPEFVVSGADYHHTEMLLDEPFRNYSASYWDKKVMAPSALLYYIGLDDKVPGLLHHNLFFDADFEKHSREIYDSHEWPADPLFYVCCPSKTDPASAPPGGENIFVLIPISTRLRDDRDRRRHYLNEVFRRMEDHLGADVRSKVLFHRTYSIDDFISDYHSYRGNAYGLANTLKQTGPLKPKIINRKIENLMYTGQLTVPGPGVPPSIISGQIVADYITQNKIIHSEVSL